MPGFRRPFHPRHPLWTRSDKTSAIERISNSSRGRRGRLRSLLAISAVLLLASACGGSATTSTNTAPSTFADIDAAMELRVRSEGLDGAGLLVVANGATQRDASYCSYTNDTVIPIASASKWLTAATMMTLVDEGRVALEDPVSKFLPRFTGSTGGATIRQLLSHTAGIAQASCVWEERQSLAECVDAVATQTPAYQPGTKFEYGNTSFSVAGRIIEVVTGQSFENAFESRIAEPLGMSHTRFDGRSYPTESNPVPAASAESTLDDYGNFVEMISNRGTFNGRRVLSEASVLEMETDSVKGLNTSSDGAVRTTGIPTYGLGTWRDITSTDDAGVVTSGNGAFGFYPWVDRARNSYGIILVHDQRGSELAVPESQRELHWVLGVLDTLGVSKSPVQTIVHRR